MSNTHETSVESTSTASPNETTESTDNAAIGQSDISGGDKVSKVDSGEMLRKPSGIAKLSALRIPAPSKIGRLCSGQQKPALPTSPKRK